MTQFCCLLCKERRCCVKREIRFRLKACKLCAKCDFTFFLLWCAHLFNAFLISDTHQVCEKKRRRNKNFNHSILPAPKMTFQRAPRDVVSVLQSNLWFAVDAALFFFGNFLLEWCVHKKPLWHAFLQFSPTRIHSSRSLRGIQQCYEVFASRNEEKERGTLIVIEQISSGLFNVFRNKKLCWTLGHSPSHHHQSVAIFSPILPTAPLTRKLEIVDEKWNCFSCQRRISWWLLLIHLALMDLENFSLNAKLWSPNFRDTAEGGQHFGMGNHLHFHFTLTSCAFSKYVTQSAAWVVNESTRCLVIIEFLFSLGDDEVHAAHRFCPRSY